MKLMHLSDLHLGKRVHEVSMLPDQVYILNQILDCIDTERPDALLICGDVYDKSIPSGEAVAVFDDFLSSLAQRELPVFIISGNHDSPERLAFGGRLMEPSGIHLSPVYNGSIEPITLRDEFGPVHFWLLPFLKPSHVRRFFPEEAPGSLSDALRLVIGKMPLNRQERNVLLTHQFVAGAATCESEEISIGGTDCVDAEIFSDFDYTALGHLHGPQNVLSSRIRYCGTPLKYSFSEALHHKSITVVHLGEKGTLDISLLPLTPLHDLREIRGTYQEVTARSFYVNAPTEDYLRITLTDEEDVPEAMGRLRTIYPNLLALRYDNTRTRSGAVIEAAADVQRKSPLELFGELYEKQNNQPLSDVQRTYLLGLMESIWED